MSSNEESLQQWKDVALWMWKVHNDAKIALFHKLHDNVSVDDEIKKEWPSREDCSECWNDDRSYDTTAVYDYLKEYYW